MKKLIKNLCLEDLLTYTLEDSQPKYRAEQLFKELYVNKVNDFSEMTTIPKTYREILNKDFAVNAITGYQTQKSTDGTVKFLFTLSDGEKIETVLIPDEKRPERFTLCVSSQVGCTLNCTFCATGKIGFKRNLEISEIIDQIIFAEKIENVKISNIVFMGMGEPMYNLKNVINAIKIITHPSVRFLSQKKITVSTVGIIKKIEELAESGLKVKLAVSLHATTDIIRQQLIPYAEKVSLRAIGDAIENFYRKTQMPITFEYIFLTGVNNSDDDAKRLSKITKRVLSKVNLIPYHDISFSGNEKIEFKEATKDEINIFADKLRAFGVNVFIRSSSGKDIDAACGQLAYSKRYS
ncbi:MAG: 23S rRNA (adenine(2503)-C(2))-methyltransferase RlmN [bacterium]